jgi:O-succinylbenzoic acid--CoA ligase
MAETCSHVALRKISAPAPQPDYHALPGVELSVDDRGCLVITADYLPETIVTNDLAELTGPGSFRWIGRFDNLINSGGVKVVPEELESRIREMTGQECAVIGLPDRKLGQKLVLVIEKSKDPTREIMIMAELKLLLPHKLQPKEIIGVEKFPRNPALKLDRRILTKMVCQKQ